MRKNPTRNNFQDLISLGANVFVWKKIIQNFIYTKYSLYDCSYIKLAKTSIIRIYSNPVYDPWDSKKVVIVC